MVPRTWRHRRGGALSHSGRSRLDGLADTDVRTAAADVGDLVDLRVRGRRGPDPQDRPQVRLSSATAAMIWPGWQKPHCATSCSSHASCTGWSRSPSARPSIVVTERPATEATGVTQGLKASPSRWLVQALHTSIPQPYLGPRIPSRSRSIHSSGRSSGASRSTTQAVRDLYSSWKPTPCAQPSGSSRPQPAAALSSTARCAAVLSRARRKATGSCPRRSAISSTNISSAARPVPENTLRHDPVEPPACTTWKSTRASGSPIASAGLAGGDGRLRGSPDGRVRGPPIGDGAVGLQGRVADGREVELRVHVPAEQRRGPCATAPRSFARSESSESSSTGPGPHSTSRASLPASACPKVSATTATPVAMAVTASTPGMASTAAALRTRRTLPRIVGGRRTIAGLAPGMSRSSVYRCRPVTRALASIREVGLPMRRCSARGLSASGCSAMRSVLASRASSP